MQSRKDEILAKKAKLAELKKQKELRQKEFSAGRHSFGTPSDVRAALLSAPIGVTADCRAETSLHPPDANKTVVKSWTA